MTLSFQATRPLYPLSSICISLFIFVGSLLLARSVWGGIFLAAVFVLLVLFGYAKACFFLLPFAGAYIGLFSLLFYVASGRNLAFAVQMAVRFGGVALAAVPGLSMPPALLVRNLTQLHCPRLITLGMLITLSFVPVLASEIRQIRGAMKTRGATSFYKPVVLYRAFLIPLVVRLVNISDTLTLSVETRGFVCHDVAPSVYKPIAVAKRDGAFIVLFAMIFAACEAGAILSRHGVVL